MENWEDLDELDESQWIKFKNDEQKTTTQSNTKERTVEKSNDGHLFSENTLRTAHPYFEATPSVKILTRNQNATKQPAVPTPGNTTVVTTTKSLQEREQEYAEARRRILGSK